MIVIAFICEFLRANTFWEMAGKSGGDVRHIHHMLLQYDVAIISFAGSRRLIVLWKANPMWEAPIPFGWQMVLGPLPLLFSPVNAMAIICKFLRAGICWKKAGKLEEGVLHVHHMTVLQYPSVILQFILQVILQGIRFFCSQKGKFSVGYLPPILASSWCWDNWEVPCHSSSSVVSAIICKLLEAGTCWESDLPCLCQWFVVVFYTLLLEKSREIIKLKQIKCMIYSPYNINICASAIWCWTVLKEKIPFKLFYKPTYRLQFPYFFSSYLVKPKWQLFGLLSAALSKQLLVSKSLISHIDPYINKPMV